MKTYYWTAKNNSSFLNKYRTARTLIGALRAARRYIDGELYGEGVISIWDCHPTESEPIRQDEKSMFTQYRWRTTK